MTKTKLGKQLRQFQYRFGAVPRVIIDCLPDEKIIESYVTCSDCGVRLVSDDDLKQAIEQSQDADEFLDIISELARHHDEDSKE